MTATLYLRDIVKKLRALNMTNEWITDILVSWTEDTWLVIISASMRLINAFVSESCGESPSVSVPDDGTQYTEKWDLHFPLKAKQYRINSVSPVLTASPTGNNDRYRDEGGKRYLRGLFSEALAVVASRLIGLAPVNCRINREIKKENERGSRYFLAERLLLIPQLAAGWFASSQIEKIAIL